MNEQWVGIGEIASEKNLRAYAAELLGTMLFVATGTAAVIVSGGDLVAIALAHGLAYAAMVYVTANISGGHINPAVTLGMIVTRRIKIAPGIVYMVAQMTGAVLATAVLYVALRDSVGNATNFGAHGINTNAVDGDGGALLIEIILTAVLVMVIFAATVSKRGIGHMAPLMIGLTVVLIYLVAVPLTGASVNPARTFGPALVSDAFDSFWIYVIGPAIGGAGGALLYYHGFFTSEDKG
jgi:MIP family channel proteins